MYPFNHKRGQTIQSDVPGVSVDRAFLTHFHIDALDAVASDADGVHAAIEDTGEDQEITTGITNPTVPRNITATAGGTAADIKAIQVIITGTNYADEVITETLPAFTENTAGIVSGSLAFKTVTKVEIPAHDATGATTSIGWGTKFGLPYKLSADALVLVKLFNNSADTGTVTPNDDELEKNVIALNGTPDGLKPIDLYILI